MPEREREREERGEEEAEEILPEESTLVVTVVFAVGLGINPDAFKYQKT